MRRFLAVFVVILVVVITGVAYAGVQADFSNSYSEVLDSQTLRIRQISNIVNEGIAIPGEFWIDFVWEQQNLIFVPTGNFGQEQVSLGFDGAYIGSWSKTCPACGATASSGTFTTTLANGLFTDTQFTLTSGDSGILLDTGAVSSSGAITGTGATPSQCSSSVSTFTGQITTPSAGVAVMTMTYSRTASPEGCEAEYGTITATRTILP